MKFFNFPVLLAIASLFCYLGCLSEKTDIPEIQLVTGTEAPSKEAIWLSHEHILVDFIGADSIRYDDWNHDSVIHTMRPYLEASKSYRVEYFVDATPAYLGRDVRLLEKLAKVTGLKIMTNTGFYGARDNQFIPAFAFEKTPEQLAALWISEFEQGIEGTSIKPGFIKIGVDAADTLHRMHQKLVEAAAITHLKTGLTIASHTGKAKGMWPQLEMLREKGVSPQAFIWVHAQNEDDPLQYLEAAKAGCWISLDGLGWELDKHLDKLLFAKEQGILGRILIAHDAGWYDPQKKVQTIQPYTHIFEQLYPALLSKGFTRQEMHQLLSENPLEAFAIKKRTADIPQ